MSNSHQFEFVIGVNPGYFHDNACATPLSVVAGAWNKAAEQVLADGGLYIPVTMHAAKAVYRAEWGCPTGGEDIVVVRGVLNPELVTDPPIRWSTCVTLICQAVQAALEQKTATLTLTPCVFAYMKA